MKIRRFEFFAMFVLLLLLNLAFTVWWNSGNGFTTAWASRLNQEGAAAAVNAIPRTFSYQGTLRDASGNLINGQVKLRLRLYSAPTGGSALHDETFNTVVVRNGAFSVVVGDAGTPIGATVFDNAQLFLGLTVNSDNEMLPRQRLHPVPWAMQATTAQTAVTANNLVQGGGVPNLVTLGAAGAKQIGFPGGGTITDSPTGMTIVGGGNKVMTGGALDVGGAVSVGGDLTVNGNWSAAAILDKGDSNGGANQRSTYPVSLNRYVVEAPDQGASPDSVPVNDAILVQLCQDEDGCTFTLGMRNWLPTLGNGLLATHGPYRFSLTTIVNNKRWWDSRRQDGNQAAGGSVTTEDGNSLSNHVAQAFDCYFTDNKYVNGADQGDTAIGFALLNWHANYTDPGMVCVLIIED